MLHVLQTLQTSRCMSFGVSELVDMRSGVYHPRLQSPNEIELGLDQFSPNLFEKRRFDVLY